MNSLLGSRSGTSFSWRYKKSMPVQISNSSLLAEAPARANDSRWRLLWVMVLLIAATDSAWSAPEVEVSNIEELYEAVNDPLNAGATILLDQGLYLLSASAPGGAARPNGGRLELQEDMSLAGIGPSNTDIVIDAANLPVSSFQGGGPPLTGAIRLGKGSNSLEWLTVRNAVAGTAGIEVDLIWSGKTSARISHVRSTGNPRGLDIRNFGPAAAGQVIEAEIRESEFFGNLTGLAEGIRIGNYNGAHGASVIVTMSGTRSHNNEIGLLVVNNRVNNASLTVFSSGNRFYENGAGTVLLGGISPNASVTAGNKISFEANGTHFVDNQAFSALEVGGLTVIGGENLFSPNGVVDNEVSVRLWGCKFSNNQVFDLGVFGARSIPPSLGVPGTGNSAVVEIRGAGKKPIVEVVEDSLPFDLNGTNEAVITHLP